MGGEAVKVVVRCRPQNSKERKAKAQTIVSVDPESAGIQIAPVASSSDAAIAKKPKRFTFDATFGEESTQAGVYEEIGFPLVESVMEGYNGTIFAYGQTGCGKTFTMQGPDVEDPPEELRGVIPRSFQHIFDNVTLNDNVKTKHVITASYIEIYNENVRDLLGADPNTSLALKEHPEKGVFVKGLEWFVVTSPEDTDALMRRGFNRRMVGSTEMNASSSRSHTIFTVIVQASTDDDVEGDGTGTVRNGKLNLVDLAGSERQSKTGATGSRMLEGIKINLSLSALGNVISALASGSGKHIPYRDSKLTRLLQSSLGGNTKTVMCAAVGPADYNYEETISTLRYANRAKNITNKPVINEDPKDALLREYKEQIEQLKAMLAASNGGVPVPMPIAGGGGEGAAGAAIAATPSEATKVGDESAAAATAATTSATSGAVSFKGSGGAISGEGGDDAAAAAALASAAAVADEAARAAEDQKKLVEKMVRAKLQQLEMTMQQHKTPNAVSDQLGASGEVDAETMARAEARRAEHELKQQKRKLKRQKQKQRRSERAKDRELTDMENYYEMKIAEMQAPSDDAEEFEREREGYLETIREQNREMALLMQICDQVLAPGQMEQIWTRSKWNEGTQTWRIPRLKMKREYASLSLPGMGGSGGRDEQGGGGLVMEGSDNGVLTQRESERESSRSGSSGRKKKGSSSSRGDVMADPRLLAGELEQQRPETRRARDRGNTSEAPDAVGALEWGPLVGGMDIVNSGIGVGDGYDNYQRYQSNDLQQGGGFESAQAYDHELETAAARPLQGLDDSREGDESHLSTTPSSSKRSKSLNLNGIKLDSLRGEGKDGGGAVGSPMPLSAESMATPIAVEIMKENSGKMMKKKKQVAALAPLRKSTPGRDELTSRVLLAPPMGLSASMPLPKKREGGLGGGLAPLSGGSGSGGDGLSSRDVLSSSLNLGGNSATTGLSRGGGLNGLAPLSGGSNGGGGMDLSRDVLLSSSSRIGGQPLGAIAPLGGGVGVGGGGGLAPLGGGKQPVLGGLSAGLGSSLTPLGGGKPALGGLGGGLSSGLGSSLGRGLGSSSLSLGSSSLVPLGGGKLALGSLSGGLGSSLGAPLGGSSLAPLGGGKPTLGSLGGSSLGGGGGPLGTSLGSRGGGLAPLGALGGKPSSLGGGMGGGLSGGAPLQRRGQLASL